MKVTTTETKILGVQVGEVSIDFLRVEMDGTFLKARFALLTDKGPTGFMDLNERGGQWSEKTIAALKAFSASLEEDALKVIFKISDVKTENKEGSENEPDQF